MRGKSRGERLGSLLVGDYLQMIDSALSIINQPHARGPSLTALSVSRIDS
jgi:hypothetical protein